MKFEFKRDAIVKNNDLAQFEGKKIELNARNEQKNKAQKIHILKKNNKKQ